jgi:hypothetical protein
MNRADVRPVFLAHQFEEIMKKLLRSLILIPSMASASLLLGGQPLNGGDQDSAKNIASNGQLGVQLWLISDQNFYNEWERPSAGMKIPEIKTATRGVPFNPIVIFTGCKADSKGLANLTYNILIKKPDGTVFTDQKGLNCWVNLPAPKRGDLQLCAQQLGIVFGPKDQDGKYLVQAEVFDRLTESKVVAVQSIELK